MFAGIRKKVGLTIVGDIACMTTRTYLTYLAGEGYIPEELWLVKFCPAPEKAVKARELPLFGSAIANLIHRNSPAPDITHDEEILSLAAGLQKVTPHPVPMTSFEYENYADKVRYIVAEDYNDPYLQVLLGGRKSSLYLYTNGGLVPDSLIAGGLRILHVHPGVVPEMRGSDCMLWSAHVRGRLGASCFYMSQGIDEGDLLGAMEFSVPNVDILEPYLTPERQDKAYRALLLGIDPHLRAMLLTRLVAECKHHDSLGKTAEKQDLGRHSAYLWMHPSIRLKAMQEFIELGRRNPDGRLRAL